MINKLKLKRIIKKYISESYLNENIILNNKFIENIENYIYKNNPKDLKFVLSNKGKIPKQFKKSGIYYRGMIVSQEDLDNIKDNKFILDNISSWTSDLSIAKKFITNHKYRIKDKNGIKLILKKKIQSNNVLFNIYDYIIYMDVVGNLDKFDEIARESAIDEKETLINTGLQINYNDIFKIL